MTGRRQQRNGDYRDSLAFFGAVIAGQSHELTNVLNIINELAGLQGDLIAANGAGEPKVARVGELAARIQKQVQRGGDMVQGINRFAHSVDHWTVVFDLRNAMEQTLALAERPARLAKVVLQPNLVAETRAVEAHLFLFHEAVYRALGVGIAATAPGGTVRFSYDLHADDVQVIVSCGQLDETASVTQASIDALRRVVTAASGVLRLSAEDDENTQIEIRIPLE